MANMYRIFQTLIFTFLVLATGIASGQDSRKVIIDADTGNEVDDFYALARILLEPSIEVLSLNAAHWQTSHWAIEKSMENSHRLNQQLLGEMDMGAEIKTLRGATARMYDWGDRAQHSAAAYDIISKAQESESLTVIALGALTNVASAVYIEPKIAKKLKLYWLGTSMDFETKVLKRNDFNPLMDPYALDYLLDSDVEMHIMPLNVAVQMEIDFKTLKEKISDHFLGKFLLKRWEDHLDGSRKNRILWDLALITSYIHPEMASTVSIKTSPDSGDRNIIFYDAIDADAIYEDFYKTLLAFERE